MGGCRCSFRSCTVKSDKKTHMFHFPVYEKLRCYRWIMNAHKYEYLESLNVSQLKNRVVCQHHFKDDCFMNFKKDKLTFEAIPTEDGPYCDSSTETKDIIAAEKAFLVENDIDADAAYLDKKAIKFVKYIDFLTIDGKTDTWIDVTKDQNQLLKPRFSKIFKTDNTSNSCKELYSNTELYVSPIKCSIDPENKQEKELTIEWDLKNQEVKDIIAKRRTTQQDLLNLGLNYEPTKKQTAEQVSEDLVLKNVPYTEQTIEQDMKCLDIKSGPAKKRTTQQDLEDLVLKNESATNQTVEQDSKHLEFKNVPARKGPPITFESSENLEIHNFPNLAAVNIQGIENIDQYQQSAVPVACTAVQVFTCDPNQSTIFNTSDQTYYYSHNQQHQSIVQNHSASNFGNNNYSLNSSQNSVQPHNNEKVKILSEKTIYQPVSIVGQFVPVLPSSVLQVPNRLKQSQNDYQIIENSTQKSIIDHEIEIMALEQKSNICESLGTECLKSNDVVIKSPPKIDILEIDQIQKDKYPTEISDSKDFIKQSEHIEKLDHIDAGKGDDHIRQIKNVENKQKSTEPVPKVSLLKNKVTPERLAAIERKRKFNKKLRDIVESCLEKPDENEIVLSSRANVLKFKDTENVDTGFSRDNPLKNSQDYTITYLEARMQKMENLLLTKIEQNSNRISELKNCIAPSKRNSVYTQTPCSEQAEKIFLFEEISKYLSSKAKDLIYEELFIYNYADKASKPKRKRQR